MKIRPWLFYAYAILACIVCVVAMTINNVPGAIMGATFAILAHAWRD